ncbi:MAG TPA: hypothetical protein VNS58_29260 [Puia sp.]|nr:hypothetical protein [Puia sp.]
MFLQIFLFEINYRLRRPAFYVYFLFVFGFSLLSFAQGSLPLVEKEFINAPAMLALFSSLLSVFMMLVSSAIMGVPLYRDIEHNTKEYYLSYPITKAGYFWGRYLGSWVFVLLIGAAIYLGAYLGTKLGPAMGWVPASRFGENRFVYYWYPYLTVLVPALFFTSSLFFGLVAIFRNVKVIYSSGLFLFLAYILANFFLHTVHNPRVIYLTDPFLVNGLRMDTDALSPEQLNTSVIPMRGLFLENRILWVSVGLLVLIGTYGRFSFERFFSPVKEKRKKSVSEDATLSRAGSGAGTGVQVRWNEGYFRKTLYSLTRIELLNIVRDNYFWIILSSGLIFLSFVFWHGPNRYDVPDFPRTVFFMFIFGDNFIFFLFLIIIFYTGETVHREKLTRYSFINDALPPPTWVLNSAKLISLCCLAVLLSLIPILLGLGVQLAKGYTQFNLSLYFSTLFVSTLPRLIEMVLFCYAVHIVVNNKFAAHGIAITVWVLMFVLSDFNYFTYNLLLYSYTPFAIASDMDGIGHMLTPILWFNVYWTLAGMALVVLGSLFYTRGMGAGLKEKMFLARQRFRGASRVGTVLLLVAFLATGGYIYYNVSYLNNYLTQTEERERKAAAEKKLKRYADLPLPKVTRIELYTDLYPETQTERTRAIISLMNKGSRPIDTLLLDGDNLTDYTLRYNGKELSYTIPLYFPRGKFNVFRPRQEASDYRLYIFPKTLMPGDTARLEINSLITHAGFENNLYAANLLHNGILFKGGMPGMGYDEGEEIGNNDIRQKYGLPKKIWRDIPTDDPVGMRNLESGNDADLVSLDITVSMPGDQLAVGPGRLEREWESGGRHYFHYVQDRPAVYMPDGIVAARWAVLRDSVRVDAAEPVKLEIYYHPDHKANLSRFMAADKDGIRYYSRAFGPYPFAAMRLVESPAYGPGMISFASTVAFNERTGWVADFRDSGQFDYIYFYLAEQLAHQWWGQQVAPNHTVGSRVLSDGLSKYAALVLMGKKYGKEMEQRALQTVGWDYSWGGRRNFGSENDLLHANEGYEWNAKTALVLYGLRGLIGEDSLNAALRQFRNEFAFRSGGIYAGSYDLYRVLQQHVPDSFRYYLRDSWEKVSFYDNKVVEVNAVPLGKNDEYRVSLVVEVKKTYVDTAGKEQVAADMNDYIDIGVYGADPRDSRGKADPKGSPGGGSPTLYLQRQRLGAGKHRIEVIVKGKPVRAGIDPEGKLMDRIRENNMKDL